MSKIIAQLSGHKDILRKQTQEKIITGTKNSLIYYIMRTTAKSCSAQDISVMGNKSQEIKE